MHKCVFQHCLFKVRMNPRVPIHKKHTYFFPYGFIDITFPRHLCSQNSCSDSYFLGSQLHYPFLHLTIIVLPYACHFPGVCFDDLCPWMDFYTFFLVVHQDWAAFTFLVFAHLLARVSSAWWMFSPRHAFYHIVP